MQYLLPCPCGNKAVVEPRQAGQVIACTCGASLSVPTMLEMTSLEPASSAAPPAQAVGRWGIKEALVLIGVVVAVVDLALLVLLLSRRPEKPPEDWSPEIWQQYIQSLSPFDAWWAWRQWRDLGLDHRELPRQAIYRESVLRWQIAMGVLLVVGATALGLIVGPLVIRGRPATDDDVPLSA